MWEGLSALILALRQIPIYPNQAIITCFNEKDPNFEEKSLSFKTQHRETEQNYLDQWKYIQSAVKENFCTKIHL